ncbi:MAG: hypothetical protein NTX25_11460 [Proteobacteria bacterium]|nr:hypothetical protein [Pseudomonadota bacterium]
MGALQNLPGDRPTMTLQQQKPTENLNIALLSANQASFSEEILVRLERRNCNFPVKTTKISEAFKALSSGRCSILIIHDTKDLPASFALRAQIAEPFAIITPTIVLLHPEHRAEATSLRNIGDPEILEYSANPAEFISAFERMMRRWNQGPLKQLAHARKLYLDREFLPFSQLIVSLRQVPELQPLVTPCMAQILLKQMDFEKVEKMLLAALKEHPRNIGIIISLVEFYLRATMPETALKIIAASHRHHDIHRLLFADQIQAHLMLNQVKECLPILEALIKEDYCGKQATEFLARCLFAEGFKVKFEKMAAKLAPKLINEFENRWHKTAG